MRSHSNSGIRCPGHRLPLHHWIARAILEPKSGSMMFLSVPFDQVPPLTYEILEILEIGIFFPLILLYLFYFLYLSMFLSISLSLSSYLSISRCEGPICLLVSLCFQLCWCQKSDGVIYGKRWISNMRLRMIR